MTHQITITMTGSDFTYSPSTLNAKIGHKVTWTSGTLGPFAISFTDQTPFLEVTFSSERNSLGEHIIEARQIQESRIGHHHYAVSLAVSGQQNDSIAFASVYLDSGCPDIIVSDDGV